MEKIILLHGIFLHSYHLSSLDKFLTQEGYQVMNISYPSRSHDIQELTNIIINKISGEFQSSQKIHLVGFSMGGLILRKVLSEMQPKNLGRLVMIATPNQGSELADFVSNNKIIKFLYGPALQDLKTTNAHKIPRISNQHFDFGIIAGSRKGLNIFHRFFQKANDGSVSVTSALSLEPKDQIILPFAHSLAPFNPIVQQQTLNFIRNGKFNQETP